MGKFSQTLTDEWLNQWVELKNFSIPLISSCTIYSTDYLSSGDFLEDLVLNPPVWDPLFHRNYLRFPKYMQFSQTGQRNKQKPNK